MSAAINLYGLDREPRALKADGHTFELLIERGADIHHIGPLDEDALMATALSNSITDDDAAEIARLLLEKGVDPKGERGDYTPLFMAENREKAKLAAVLREFGA